MPLSLYDVVVPQYSQILAATRAQLDKAEAFCASRNLPPSDLINAKLFEDMFPFSYQVKSTATHSVGALQAVKKGVFSPDQTPPPNSFAALKETVDGALRALAGFTRDEINALEGRDMRLEFRDYRRDFTAEGFLLSFSIPNFYFHATTAYDILRHNGVAIGKRDFTGKLRIKT